MDANIDHLLDETADSVTYAPWQDPGYSGSIDYRIRQLSYSSRLILHACPRKYELARKRTGRGQEPWINSKITLAFGQVVGEGIQQILQGKSLTEAIFAMFLRWDTPDILDINEKESKSFFHAILAVKRFVGIRAELLKDYDVVIYKGKPACELGFAIHLPDGFRYRGFVDSVLQHRRTGKILVLEVKTTKSQTLNPNKYRNSAQGIGYSVILDTIFNQWSSYEVLYLIYQSTLMEYTTLPFEKDHLQRALWIRELLLDVEMIQKYETEGIYPMHGESCVQFSVEAEKFSNVWEGDCEFINSCTLSTQSLIKTCTKESEDKNVYDIHLSIADLLQTQIERTEA